MENRTETLQKRMIYLLQELDDYGYTREEILEDLNSNNPSTEKETVMEYFDLKIRIDERLNHMNSHNVHNANSKGDLE